MKIRNVKMVAIIAAGSLALSACSIPVALSDTSATLGANQYLQVHLTTNLFARDPSLAKEIKVLKQLSYDVDYQSASGAPLSSALSTAKSQIVVSNGSQRVLTIVDVHSNEYLNINIASLANIAGLGLTTAKLAPINLIFGGRWFEFPYSLLAKYEISTLHVRPTRTSTVKNDILLVNSVVSFFANQPTTTTVTGFTQDGTLASLQSALAAIVKTATTSTTAGSTVLTTKSTGTYKLAVTMSGDVATYVKLAITAPAGTYGNGTFTLSANFAHASVNVSAPTGALVITNTFLNQLGIKQLGSNGGGVLSGVLG